ncbi:uncharacterized protein LOC125875192 [Solanum stenotomum]|uniref:uncharacterized protein LOC125875192 n=1 Tax=Solanum stenotomum TaxID=172797 RepID=UPI0020D09DFE|nr:uncharacterized protein LOC125875192 [Solanum stenotomum]
MDFDEERNEETDQPNEDVEMADKVGDREADELKPSNNGCSVRQLFVGRISTKTTEVFYFPESFREYFSKFGQVADSVLMSDKDSGRRRGIGFVIYADPEIADKVLKEDHTIDGKKVVVEKPVTNTTRIYVGGLPLSLTEDELKEHFSPYGNVVDHCIVLDRRHGRSRRFGYVSFDKEEAVEKVLSDGHMHELCGKQVSNKEFILPRTDCCLFYFDETKKNCRAGAAGYGGSSYGVHAYYGRGSGYGNSGSSWSDGGNRGYGGGGKNDAYAYGNSGAANERYVPAYNGRGRGYGNSGNSWNDGGNGGYGGGGRNDAYAYGNTGAANERYVPAYNGCGRGYGNSGNSWNYGGNGGYGGGGTNGAYAYENTGAANRRYHPY